MPSQNNLRHIAIVMDGNRTWATTRGLPKLMGHTEGAKTLKKIATAVREREIPYLTVWALSTENLKERSPEELKHLFSLFNQLTNYLEDFFKHNARVLLIGNISELPAETQKRLGEMVEKTKSHTAMTLILAVNYGGRDEILRATKKMLAAGVSPEGVTEETFKTYLDTANIPDPDLIIRTAGHQRLSGYLPWQSTYAELYFTDVQWPAFSEKDLDDAIAWFQNQKRNHGK